MTSKGILQGFAQTPQFLFDLGNLRITVFMRKGKKKEEFHFPPVKKHVVDSAADIAAIHQEQAVNSFLQNFFQNCFPIAAEVGMRTAVGTFKRHRSRIQSFKGNVKPIQHLQRCIFTDVVNGVSHDASPSLSFPERQKAW